jgi:hypothetical protein
VLYSQGEKHNSELGANPKYFHLFSIIWSHFADIIQSYIHLLAMLTENRNHPSIQKVSGGICPVLPNVQKHYSEIN